MVETGGLGRPFSFADFKTGTDQKYIQPGPLHAVKYITPSGLALCQKIRKFAFKRM
jgi:hypothetical protein